MRVRIHPNRHMVKAGIESCISVTRPRKVKGRYTTYSGTVVLRDVTFPIQPAGLARAQREGVRNVHAWAEGEILTDEAGQIPLSEKTIRRQGLRQVTYHFQDGEFRDLNSGEPVTEAEYLYAVGRDFYYKPKD